MNNQTVITMIHGIPLTFQEVDNPDQVIGGCDKSYNQLKETWIDYLNGSDSVKKGSSRIEKMHVGTLAYFYFIDAEIPFYCKEYKRASTLDRCEDCPNWDRSDNECGIDSMGEYIDKQPLIRNIPLDTMHILRVTLKAV